MDFFFPYRNPNFQSSSLDTTNNKTSNSFNGNEVERKQQRNKRTNNKMTTKAKLSTDPQSVAARERRHRISEKFKILRSLIPGGDTKNMDTVSMLEEAIQYVKHLKSQIWLHQTMISFENFAGYNNHENLVGYNNHDASRNDNNHVASRNGNHLDQCPHQGFPHFDHFYGEYNHHEMLPQLGFSDGASFKVEDEDHMVSVSHDHQHHHGMYP